MVTSRGVCALGAAAIVTDARCAWASHFLGAPTLRKLPILAAISANSNRKTTRADTTAKNSSPAVCQRELLSYDRAPIYKKKVPAVDGEFVRGGLRGPFSPSRVATADGATA